MSLSDLNWLEHFSPLGELNTDSRNLLMRESFIKRSRAGEMAYRQGDRCEAFVIRLKGFSRVQKTSESGRGILLYRVGPYETCVLTTSCLLGNSHYPAESIVESETTDVIIPAAIFGQLLKDSEPFSRFVFANYGQLIADLIVVIDDVTFTRVDVRLARWLTARLGAGPSIESTHQEIAVDLGSSREVISRLLKDFERKGLVHLGRGHIRVDQADVLASWLENTTDK